MSGSPRIAVILAVTRIAGNADARLTAAIQLFITNGRGIPPMSLLGCVTLRDFFRRETQRPTGDSRCLKCASDYSATDEYPPRPVSTASFQFTGGKLVSFLVGLDFRCAADIHNGKTKL